MRGHEPLYTRLAARKIIGRVVKNFVSARTILKLYIKKVNISSEELGAGSFGSRERKASREAASCVVPSGRKA
jgi:hypothetical protein